MTRFTIKPWLFRSMVSYPPAAKSPSLPWLCLACRLIWLGKNGTSYHIIVPGLMSAVFPLPDSLLMPPLQDLDSLFWFPSDFPFGICNAVGLSSQLTVGSPPRPDAQTLRRRRGRANGSDQRSVRSISLFPRVSWSKPPHSHSEQELYTRQHSNPLRVIPAVS